MSITTVLKNLVPGVLKEKLKDHFGVPSQRRSFQKLKNAGFKADIILDIGAYEGNWARDFKKIYPDAKILMIEAQTEKEPSLSSICRNIIGLEYKIALLGASNTEVDFNVYETASSILTEHHPTKARIELRTMNCLDHLTMDSVYAKPDLIKIDTQGYELEILKGAKNTLLAADAVLLEVSLLDIYKDVPLVNEVMEFMKAHGFVLYDICSMIYRPLDLSLYQSDFLFVKESLSLRQNKHWNIAP